MLAREFAPIPRVDGAGLASNIALSLRLLGALGRGRILYGQSKFLDAKLYGFWAEAKGLEATTKVNVHLITRNYKDDHILGRLARALVDCYGWSVGPAPRGDVDLNHFMCYIEYAEKFPNWHQTPISAYFTHHEVGNVNKEWWWRIAARDVDLRIITAKQYEGQLVRPGVDRELFRPGDRPENHDPVVGVCGFVDSSGRKGRELVQELAQRTNLNIKALGRGWGVPCQNVAFTELPSFYQALDVYLCSSLIEGIPAPPLEALASGVPVVIPRGVGMLDDLPDMPGICRFEAGNYASMEKAVKIALKAESDPQELRAATEPYSLDSWCEDHLRAFESLLYDQEAIEDLPTWRGNSGMYMVAYGEPSRKCAARAIETFKKHNPDIPVALASDKPLGPEDIFIEHPDVCVGGRAVKTKMWDLAPQEWVYVLYLDADTETIAPIDFIFQLLNDGWEFVICKEPGKYHNTLRMTRPDNKPECDETYKVMGTKEALQLNGGVCAFRRCERTEKLIRGWHDEWQRWGKRDQAALFRSLYTYTPRTYVLGVEWNTVVNYYMPERSAGILHYPMEARRWSGIIWDRTDSQEAWRKVGAWRAKQKHVSP